MSRRIDIPARDTSAPVRVPTQQGGGKKPSGVHGERHTSAQDPLYREWVDAETWLSLSFSDGTSVEGVLQAYDTYALHVVTPAGLPMVAFKQSLRWIVPTGHDVSSPDTV